MGLFHFFGVFKGAFTKMNTGLFRRCSRSKVFVFMFFLPSFLSNRYPNKLEFADLLNGISEANIKRCDQQFLQIFIVVLEKEFYSLTVVFFCVKLPV